MEVHEWESLASKRLQVLAATTESLAPVIRSSDMVRVHLFGDQLLGVVQWFTSTPPPPDLEMGVHWSRMNSLLRAAGTLMRSANNAADIRRATDHLMQAESEASLWIDLLSPGAHPERDSTRPELRVPDDARAEGPATPRRGPDSYWSKRRPSPAPLAPDGPEVPLVSGAADRVAARDRPPVAGSPQGPTDLAPVSRPLAVGDTDPGYWLGRSRKLKLTDLGAVLPEDLGPMATGDIGIWENADTAVRPSGETEDASDLDTAWTFEYFVDDDQGYLEWLDRHAEGFVLNCHRRLRLDYLVLHRATCYLISGSATPGRSRTKDMIKLCATGRDDLEAWARYQMACPPKPCRWCDPGTREIDVEATLLHLSEMPPPRPGTAIAIGDGGRSG